MTRGQAALAVPNLNSYARELGLPYPHVVVWAGETRQGWELVVTGPGAENHFHTPHAQAARRYLTLLGEEWRRAHQ